MGKTININEKFYITEEDDGFKYKTNLFDPDIENVFIDSIDDDKFLKTSQIYNLFNKSILYHRYIELTDNSLIDTFKILIHHYKVLGFTPEQIKERLPSNYMQYKTFKRFLNYMEKENDDVNVSNSALTGDEILCNFFWKDENIIWLDMVLSYVNEEYRCVIIADFGEEGKIQKQKYFKYSFFELLRYLESLIKDFSHIFEREKRLRLEELAETIKKFNIED